MWTKRYIISVTLITMAILAIGGILWNKDTGSLTPETYGGFDSQWSLGASNAAIIIDVYLDFTCQVCVEKERVVLQALDLYPESVRMIYHHYPISELGQKIAEALEAAGEQGKFWELHDRLIEDVPTDIFELKACAGEIGLDMKKFDEALESGKFSEEVKLTKQQAVSQGVSSTSVYINWIEYQHYPGKLSDLCAAINEELEGLGDCPSCP